MTSLKGTGYGNRSDDESANPHGRYLIHTDRSASSFKSLPFTHVFTRL